MKLFINDSTGTCLGKPSPSVKLLLNLLDNPASELLFVSIGLCAEHSKGWAFAAVLMRTRRSFSLQNIFPNV